MIRIFILVLFVAFVNTYNNGVGKTPAMVSEDLIVETMKGLQRYGLDKAGYKYINIDDCWQLIDRDKTTGKPVPDPERFKNGIPFLTDLMHKNGLNLGLYTDIGTETCQGRTGSYGHYEIDAKTYAEWKIDYIKVDFCHTLGKESLEPSIYYTNFSNHINDTGRSILYSICNWGVKDPWKWAPKIANMWRTTGDIRPEFYSVLENMKKTEVLSEYAGLYNYNDPDMLEVGVVRGDKQLSMIENKAHFSLWCLMAAPLLLGNDLRNISKEVLDIISNEEVIAINQDDLGIQGKIVKEEKEWLVLGACLPIGDHCRWIQIWKKELNDGKIAVGLFNHADEHESESEHFKEGEKIKVTWEELGLKKGNKYSLRDVWGKKDLGVFDSEFESTVEIKQHDIFVFIMTPI